MKKEVYNFDPHVLFIFQSTIKRLINHSWNFIIHLENVASVAQKYFFVIMTRIFALCNNILGKERFWEFGKNISLSWSVECPSACNTISIIADVLRVSESQVCVISASLAGPHQSSLLVYDNRIRSAPSQIDGSSSVSRYILRASGMKTHPWVILCAYIRPMVEQSTGH